MVAGGVTFGPRPFELDPIPRILTRQEWEALGRGLVQRARALEAFVDDAYGAWRIVEAGAMPARVISSCSFFEPRLREVALPGRRLAVCGFDVIRDPEGEFMVLEDNLRTPSGIVYALAARELGGQELADAAGMPIAPVDSAPALLADALREALPDVAEPRMVLLADGSGVAFAEHARIAKALGAAPATPEELRLREGQVRLADDRGEPPIDLIYRRSDEDRLWEHQSGERTALGRVLAEPVLAGRVAVANAFGTGVGDDKLTHGYVERMIRFYLSEEPLLRSVPSVDLEPREQRTVALEHLDEMVVKPRDGAGGEGVVVPDDSDSTARAAAREAVQAAPGEIVAQERIAISTLPCVSESGALEPRRVDLRTFALASPGGFRVAPCALTRFAARGSAKVNSSAGGGGKDTWVLA